MLLPLLLVGGYFVARTPPTKKDESAAGTGPADLAGKMLPPAVERIRQRRLAPSIGRPPLTVDDGQYGFVEPVPGRPDGLGSEPGLGDNTLISAMGGLQRALNGRTVRTSYAGVWRQRGADGPDIFLRGPAVGVSDDNLALVRRRGGLE
jgi:hypothetical protein